MRPDLTDITFQKLPCDLSYHAGLALAGRFLQRISVPVLMNLAFPVRSGAANVQAKRREIFTPG